MSNQDKLMEMKEYTMKQHKNAIIKTRQGSENPQALRALK